MYAHKITAISNLALLNLEAIESPDACNKWELVAVIPFNAGARLFWKMEGVNA